MTLSELICNRMRTEEHLSGLLAVFYDKPAVFEDEAPPDQQDGWGRRTQYPRICYHINMRVNQERASAGELSVTVFVRKDLPMVTELEKYIKTCLQDVIMTPDEASPFCVAWSKSETYIQPGAEILCMDILFDILEYATQETTDPDPVMALSAELKKLYPEALVIGLDALPDYTDPSVCPVLYVRLQSISETTGHCSHSIVWFLANMAIHILYASQQNRLIVSAGIHQSLSLGEEIIMLDESPMIINQNTLNNRADYLRDGQVAIVCKYGCLRHRKENKKIRRIYNYYVN